MADGRDDTTKRGLCWARRHELWWSRELRLHCTKTDIMGRRRVEGEKRGVWINLTKGEDRKEDSETSQAKVRWQMRSFYI